MQISLAAGAEVDIASGKEVAAGFDDLKDFMEKGPARPSYTRVVMAAAITPPFTGILQVGGPPIGRIWNVLSYAILGQNDSVVSAAGTVGIYIGTPPSSGTPNYADLIWTPRVVPQSQSWGTEVYWAHPGDYIYLSANGIDTITQLTAVFGIAEWRQKDITMRTGR